MLLHTQPRKYKYDLKSPGHKPKNQAGTISRAGKPRFPWPISEISGSASSIDSLHTPSSPNPDLVTGVSSPKSYQPHHHHHPSNEIDVLATETSQSPEEIRTNTPPPPELPPKDYAPPLPPKPPNDNHNLLPLPPRSIAQLNVKSEMPVKNSIPLPPKDSFLPPKESSFPPWEPSGKNELPLPPREGGGGKHGRHSVPAIFDHGLLSTTNKAPPLPPKAKISS